MLFAKCEIAFLALGLFSTFSVSAASAKGLDDTNLLYKVHSASEGRTVIDIQTGYHIIS